jgi:WD40 repeat protein
MQRRTSRWRDARAGIWLLAIGFCLHHAPGWATAQNQGTPQEAELRRQLQVERAARLTLTYQADMRKAAQLAEIEEWQPLGAILNQYEPAAGDTDVRDWEWHFLQSLVKKKQLADRQESAFQGPPAAIYHLAWSGNGERLATVGEGGVAVIWDWKTGRELRRFGSGARLVSWDHDGRLLTITAENQTVTLWDAETGRARRFFGPFKGLYNYRQPAFSPDGRSLAVVWDETSAVIINTVTLKAVHRLTGHQGLISAVVWDASGQRLATGASDGKVKIWGAASGVQMATLDAGGDVVGLEWSRDGRQVAAVTWPGPQTRQVRIWDVASRERVFTTEFHGGGTYRANQRRVALVMSGDGKRIAAESSEGVTVWETATGRAIFHAPLGASVFQSSGCDPAARRWGLVEALGTHATCRVLDMDSSDDLLRVDVDIPMNNYQSALAWSPDGRRLATGFAQGRVNVYDVPKDHSEIRIVNLGTAAFFNWSPSGERFAFSTQGEVRIGSLPAGRPSLRLGEPLTLPSVVRLSPDGKYLAGADHDGTLPIWQVSSSQIIRRLPGHPPLIGKPLGRESRAAHALLWSPDGSRLASVRYTDGGLRIWDVKTGLPQAAFQFGENAWWVTQHDALPIAWSRDGNFLAARTGVQGKKVRILDLTTGKQITEWDGGPDLGSSNAMAWDSTGQRLATCLGNPPRIQVWNVRTGEEMQSLQDPVLSLTALSWSLRGKRLAYIADRKATLYDFVTKRSTPLAENCEHLVWNADGSRLAVVGPGLFGRGFVEVYDPTTSTVIPGEGGLTRPDPAAMRLPQGVNDQYNLHLQSVVWSEQGLQAVGDAMPYPGLGRIVVWDLRTGKPLLTLGQTYDVLRDRARVARMVAWSPDGRLLATLAGESHDSAHVDIWDATTGQKMQSLIAGRVQMRGVAGLAWSPDGKRVAFTGEAVQVWNLALPLLPLTLRQAPKRGSDAEQAFLAWSRDSRSLAALECSGTTHQAVVTGWDMSTGKERFTWTRPYEYSYLHEPIAWSPDGKYLACGGPRGAVWNVQSTREEFVFAGHGAPVTDVQWSLEARRVLSRSEISSDVFSKISELKVWDAARGLEVLTLRGPAAGWVVAPGFQALACPPGRGSDPGDVIVWDLTARR